MQNLLDQQQRQALQDKKVLEEYKSEISGLIVRTWSRKKHFGKTLEAIWTE